MTSSVALFLNSILKIGAIVVIFNELRGLILAGPVIYAMYQAGGTLTAIWLGLCSLGGIALSVIVPIVVARKIGSHVEKRLGQQIA